MMRKTAGMAKEMRTMMRIMISNCQTYIMKMTTTRMMKMIMMIFRSLSRERVLTMMICIRN